MLWKADPDHTELLRVVISEVPTARAFFEHFLADNAAFSIAEADEHWNEHGTPRTVVVLEPWATEQKRKYRFFCFPATPIPVGFIPRLEMENIHRYQFVMDQRDGLELLQFEANFLVFDSGGMPYSECFTTRQLWTVRPIPHAEQSHATSCELQVTFEIHFIGRPPLWAAVIKNRNLMEHRVALEGWLRGAHASLKPLSKQSAASRQVNSRDVRGSAPGSPPGSAPGGKAHRSGFESASFPVLLMLIILVANLVSEFGPISVTAAYHRYCPSIFSSIGWLGI